MKKSDLKTGMRATNRRGTIYIVLLNASTTDDNADDEFVSFDGSQDPLDCYNDDLTNSYDYFDLDIVKVETPVSFNSILKPEGKYVTVWQRETVKEMTVEEIQQALGYKIKIVE